MSLQRPIRQPQKETSPHSTLLHLNPDGIQNEGS
jgi:hypothetical protein